jgi:hypothetical protein
MLRHVLPFLAVLSACATAPDAGSSGPVSVTPRAIWGDADLTLRAGELSDSVVIRANGDTTPLVQRRLDDTTIAVRLMPGARGAVQLTVDVGSRRLLAEPVTVYGFIRQFDYDARTDILQSLDILPGKVLGGDAQGMVMLDPAAGTMRRYPGTGQFSGGAFEGPGPTPEDNVFIADPGFGNPIRRWRLFPETQPLEFLPLNFPRYAMQLSTNVLLASQTDQFDIWVRPDEASGYLRAFHMIAAVDGVVMSPRHDRGAIIMRSATEQVPVFDASGAIAWRMPLSAARGVDFSADGELLAAVGRASGLDSTSHLYVLRASDGTVVRDTAFEDEASAVHFDPVLPLIYVTFLTSDSAGAWPVLAVLQRDTFRRVASISVPHDAGQCVIYGTCYNLAITRGPEPIVSVISGWRSYTFDLPPGADTFSVVRAP